MEVIFLGGFCKKRISRPEFQDFTLRKCKQEVQTFLGQAARQVKQQKHKGNPKQGIAKHKSGLATVGNTAAYPNFRSWG